MARFLVALQGDHLIYEVSIIRIAYCELVPRYLSGEIVVIVRSRSVGVSFGMVL